MRIGLCIFVYSSAVIVRNLAQTQSFTVPFEGDFDIEVNEDWPFSCYLNPASFTF